MRSGSRLDSRSPSVMSRARGLRAPTRLWTGSTGCRCLLARAVAGTCSVFTGRVRHCGPRGKPHALQDRTGHTSCSCRLPSRDCIMAAGHAGLGPDSQLARPAHARRGSVGVVAELLGHPGDAAAHAEPPDGAVDCLGHRFGGRRVRWLQPGGEQRKAPSVVDVQPGHGELCSGGHLTPSRFVLPCVHSPPRRGSVASVYVPSGRLVPTSRALASLGHRERPKVAVKVAASVE